MGSGSKNRVVNQPSLGFGERIANIAIPLDRMHQPHGIVQHLPEKTPDILVRLGRVIAKRGIKLRIFEQYIAHIVAVLRLAGHPVQLSCEIYRAVIPLVLFVRVATPGILGHGDDDALPYHAVDEASRALDFCGKKRRKLVHRRDGRGCRHSDFGQCRRATCKRYAGKKRQADHRLSTPSKELPRSSTRGSPIYSSSV